MEAAIELWFALLGKKRGVSSLCLADFLHMKMLYQFHKSFYLAIKPLNLSEVVGRHQRIMPIFLPNMLFGIATVFDLLCPIIMLNYANKKCITVITLTLYMNLRSCLVVIML